MAFKLERFRIEGLHGTRNIDIPIKNNKLILVGENGTGKSTVANFIYFFLTRQWWRMWQYEFDAVTITIDSAPIQITATEITLPGEEILRLTRPSSQPNSRFLRDLRNLIVHRSGEGLNWELITAFLQESDIPSSVIRKLIERDNDLFSLRVKDISSLLQLKFNDYQVLYLPTYRRIEKELESILQKSRIEELRYRRVTTVDQPVLVDDSNETDFVELVEFGMKDVETKFQETMSYLKDDLTNNLNKLTGTYLREVVLGTYKTNINREALSEINVDTVQAILSRVGEELLSDADKQGIIERIRNDIHLKDDVVAHFLIRLNELYKLQQDNEKDIKEFVRVCNVYLKGKRIVYDASKYRINIFQTQDLDNSSPILGNEIRLRYLSSGEKQIISLFAHIYLSGKTGYFVVIDEPELSLSVPWQKIFLPDILNSGRCAGLIAVTHSPFIFDNDLRSYVYSLEDFVEQS